MNTGPLTVVTVTSAKNQTTSSVPLGIRRQTTFTVRLTTGVGGALTTRPTTRVVSTRVRS